MWIAGRSAIVQIEMKTYSNLQLLTQLSKQYTTCSDENEVNKKLSINRISLGVINIYQESVGWSSLCFGSRVRCSSNDKNKWRSRVLRPLRRSFDHRSPRSIAGHRQHPPSRGDTRKMPVHQKTRSWEDKTKRYYKNHFSDVTVLVYLTPTPPWDTQDLFKLRLSLPQGNKLILCSWSWVSWVLQFKSQRITCICYNYSVQCIM